MTIQGTEAHITVYFLPIVQGDSTRLDQLFQNLLTNALKFINRISRVFQRLHGRNQFSATGVGLVICQKVAASRRGVITVYSQFLRRNINTVRAEERNIMAMANA